jgi:hypothetical protein
MLDGSGSIIFDVLVWLNDESHSSKSTVPETR